MKIHPFQPTPPPSVIITIDDEYAHFSWDVRCQFFWWKYKQLILCFSFLILSAIIAITIVALKSSSSSSSSSISSSDPCETYRSDDFASGVSLACLRSIWSKSGCVEKGKGTIPDGYSGWWLRSPSGGKTVPCVYPNIDDKCGAGNYGTIINNLWVCDLNYRGY